MATPPDDGHDDPPGSNNGDDGDGGQPPADQLATVLRTVAAAGIDRATPADLGDLLGLRCVQDRAPDTSEDGLTAAARDVIRDALAALGDGNYGKAARLLFGATDDTRGQPSRERRRVAAYQIDVMPDWFGRRYLPQITKDVAAQVLAIENASTTDDTTTEASNDGPTGVVRIADATRDRASITPGPDTPGVEPSRWRRLFPQRPDSTAPVGLTRGAQAPEDSLSRRLVRSLQALGDERTRKQRRTAFVVIGIVIWVRYGTTATARYVLALAVLGLVIAAADIVAEWRATRTLALRENWPRVFLLACMIVFAGGFVLDHDRSDDDEQNTAEHDPCQGLTPDPSCDIGIEGTTTTVADPQRTDVTYTDPHDAVPPECPPEGNTDRRVTFTDPPPLCIDTTALYVARVETNYGPFDIELNTADAPYVVNNFVFLARWHFYDGVVLEAPDVDYMVAAEPVIPELSDQAPGYSMEPDQEAANYPEHGYYVVVTDPQHPNRWAIPVTDDMRQRIETDGYPMLGRIISCEDIILADEVPRATGGPMVIETITIHQLNPDNTTTTNEGGTPRCREVIEDIPGGSIPNPGGTP